MFKTNYQINNKYTINVIELIKIVWKLHCVPKLIVECLKYLPLIALQ